MEARFPVILVRFDGAPTRPACGEWLAQIAVRLPLLRTERILHRRHPSRVRYAAHKTRALDGARQRCRKAFTFKKEWQAFVLAQTETFHLTPTSLLMEDRRILRPAALVTGLGRRHKPTVCPTILVSL